MTALSDRIAAEHRYDDGTRKCRCGVVMYVGEGSKIIEVGPHAYGRHVAAVTERAVRDAIAAELEAKAADLAAPRHDGEEITGFTLRLVHAEHLTNAARIAREGTTP